MFITNFTQKLEHWAAEKEYAFKISEKYYVDIINKEIILANITKNDNILCIGGGSCPFSAILLHRLTGAKITVIDINDECVKKAQSLIQRLGLSDSIKVLCADGCEKLASDYTVIHFALQVSPLEQVFSNVLNYASDETRILVRVPKKPLKKLYSSFTMPVLEFCPSTAHKSLRNLGRTLLYIKGVNQSVGMGYQHGKEIFGNRTWLNAYKSGAN